MRKVAFVLFVSLVSATAARADRALTLDDALQIARSRNRDLKAARARLEQARTGIEQARIALLPTVTAQGKYTHNYKEVTLDLAQENAALFGLAEVIKATSGNPVQNGAINQFEQQAAAATAGPPIIIQKAEQLDFVLAATIPLFIPSAYPGLTAARKTYAAAESTYEVTETSLLYSTAQAFYGAAGADELVGARKHAIEVNKQTVDNARARLEAGVVNKVEVTRAELTLLRAEQAMREAIDTQVQAYRSLATILLLREPFHVVSETAQPTPAASLDDMAKQALSLRPEVKQLERSIDASDATVKSNWYRWAPSLSGFGNVRAFNYPGFSGDQYSWALGLQLDWLIYDGGARDSQRHLAEAQKHESELRLEQLRDSITDDLENARRALDTKRAALDTAVRAVALSQETLDTVRVQHDAGTATQLDLLTAQDNLVTSEVAVAQARFDLALADLTLKRTAGTFPSH